MTFLERSITDQANSFEQEKLTMTIHENESMQHRKLKWQDIPSTLKKMTNTPFPK